MRYATFVALFSLAMGVSAEPVDNRVYMGLQAGALISDDSDSDNGPLGMVIVGKPLSKNWALEGNFGYADLNVEGLADSEDYERMTLGADARYTVNPSSSWPIYFLAGVNTHKIEFLEEDLQGFGGNVGFGVLGDINNNLKLRLDARYFLDSVNGEGIVPDDTFYSIGATVGLQYHFGPWPPLPPDSDRDGVPDATDQCPNTPRGTPVNAVGCPLDSDGDGVSNDRDKCPNTPKGVPVDADGCPFDQDKDGVADNIDQCPNTPLGVRVDAVGCPLDTDKDGVPDYIDECPNTPLGVRVDARGCALDTDKDGVPDHRDRCPNTPLGTPVDQFGCHNDKDGDGVVNRYDHCPNTFPNLKVNARGCAIKKQTLVLNNIHFEFNKAVLLPDSRAILDKVAATLVEQKDIALVVEGHADSVGGDQYNLKLSQKRAEAVVRHLAAQGVASNRMKAIGYGESRPIATNETEEGRSKNRRVAFKLQ